MGDNHSQDPVLFQDGFIPDRFNCGANPQRDRFHGSSTFLIAGFDYILH